MARPSRKSKALESLSGADALSILKMLAERDSRFAGAIDAAAHELLSDVDAERLSAEVKDALECLEPEDVWDHSGRTRDGYVEPSEAAWEVFDEALQPFREEMEKYQKLAMTKEADRHCQGLLKGIYDFDEESATQYKEWAMDAPAEYFGLVLKDWKALHKERVPLSKMQDFIEKQCPAYAHFAVRILRSKSG